MRENDESLPQVQPRNRSWDRMKQFVGAGDVEAWSVQQVQFSEHSRMAVRRALWFLRLVEHNSEDKLLRHAQSKAHEQIDAVTLPSKPEHICRPGDPKSKCPYSGAIEPEFATLAESWKSLVDDLDPTKQQRSAQQLRSSEKAMVHFIKRSRPANKIIRITYSVVPALRRLALQHVGLLVTFAVGLVVCAGVEAVRSIMMNAPLLTGLTLISAFVPLLILLLIERTAFRHRAAPWNLGGRVVHSVRTVLLDPEPWVTRHPKGYVKWIYLSLMLKVAVHMALWFLMGVALKALIPVFGWDDVVFTVYLIVMLWAFVVLLGGAIDFADMHSPSPLRWMMVAGALVAGLAIIMFDSPSAAPIAIGIWLAVLIFWSLFIRNLPSLGVPATIAVVMFVGLYLTESRQSEEVWTPQVPTVRALDRNDWPSGSQSSGPVVVLAASGGGSRAAIFAAKTLEALDSSAPKAAANLQAISSVSGGSLASAAYISQRLRRMGALTDAAAACNDSLSKAVSRDFIQPTIMGLVRKGGRGKAIERAWEECPVGLADLSIDKLALVWRESKKRGDSGAPFPIPLFNSVSLERNAVVISPLDQQLFTSAFDAEARDTATNAYRRIARKDTTAIPTWVYYRSGIYHLQDLSGGMNAPLSAAVRASANFPFGFPLVEVKSLKPLHYSTTMANPALDEAEKTVRLTDGGALSNSGMWPLVPLLLNQRKHIGNRRGVLMIVVDASRMPEAGWTDRQRGLLATILDKSPKGERLHRDMLEQLEASYGGCFGYVYIGIEPRSDLNVYTTWALDRGSLTKVDRAFAAAWKDAGPELQREYDRLLTCDNNERRALRPGRVPLS